MNSYFFISVLIPLSLCITILACAPVFALITKDPAQPRIMLLRIMGWLAYTMLVILTIALFSRVVVYYKNPIETDIFYQALSLNYEEKVDPSMLTEVTLTDTQLRGKLLFRLCVLCVYPPIFTVISVITSYQILGKISN